MLVLTMEVNDYSQHGIYYIKLFKNKDTARKGLYKALASEGEQPTPELIEHILLGGGRIDYEDKWFYLFDEKGE